MKMAKWIVAVSCLFCVSANAGDWTKADTAWQLTYAVFHVADWGQTLDIAESCYTKTNTYDNNFSTRARTVSYSYCEYNERNSILGERPSRGDVNTYFATTLILHTAIAVLLPPDYRRIWQVLWIGAEITTVSRNARAGINMTF